jgi:tRNA A37 threonylcarbamoyladenosine dehydratase
MPLVALPPDGIRTLLRCGMGLVGCYTLLRWVRATRRTVAQKTGAGADLKGARDAIDACCCALGRPGTLKSALGLAIKDPPLLRHERFGKNELLLGAEAVRKLASSRVLIMGCGGVGSWVVESLARAGVGCLVLVDPGLVKISNCSQQIPALASTIGRHKVDVLAARLRDINPDIYVLMHPFPADEHSAVDILTRFGRTPVDPATCACEASCPTLCSRRPLFDAVVDCADKCKDKIAMQLAALQAGVPCVVTSMGAATRLNPGDVRVADISKTSHCPMGKRVILSPTLSVTPLPPPPPPSAPPRPRLPPLDPLNASLLAIMSRVLLLGPSRASQSGGYHRSDLRVQCRETPEQIHDFE